MRALALFLGIFLFGIPQVFGQVKIGDNPQTIHPAAVLELESTTTALIITRVSTEQMQAIVPSQGALVYNTDTACVHYYNGTEWINLCSSTGNINVTTDPIVNQTSTIVLTTTANGNNLEVAPESIRSEQILDGSIFGDDINDNSIGANKLANNSVVKSKLSENAVGPFAIDRDSLPLSFFNNDVPFLTSGDLTTVSANDGNSITSGTDGGAYYNQQALLEAIAANTADIANDLDTNPENELQNLSLSGNILTLSDPVNGDDTIDLESFAGGGGNPTDELQDLAFDTNTNILTLTTPATAGNQVDLSALAGGSGTTEVVDGILLSGLGTTGSPFTIIPSATTGQFLRTDALGNVIWDDLPGGTGGAVNSDGLTITGDGITTDLAVLDGGITPIKLEPSTNLGDFLTTDATGAVVWTTVAPGGGSTEIVDDITLTGAGITGDPFKIEPSITTGQFLKTDDTGAVVWDDLPAGTGGTVNSDGLTISGDGVTTDLAVLDAGITPIKIAPSANINEVLTTDASGNVTWAAGGGTGSTELADQVTITGDGQVGTEFQVADAGISTLQLANDAVTTSNIVDEAVTPAKIEAGINGQVLSTNAAGDVVWNEGGETNTASNEGVGGEGLFIQKTAENLEFKNLNAGSNKIIITDDAVNNEIDIDIEEANLSISAVLIPYDPSIVGILPVTVTDAQTAIDALATEVDSDSQNIEGSVLTDETLTIGIEDGASQDVDLSPFALDTDVAAAIAATELADGDRDDRNEIQSITSTDGTVTITQTDDDFNLSVSGSAVSGTEGSVFFADTDGSATENNTQLFWDTTFGANGGLGIGNNSPQSKLHVSGEIRSTGYNSSFGTEGSPAYSFISGATVDSNTGMYRKAADELGFSVGGNLALTIDEPSTGITNVIVNGGFSTNIRTESAVGNIDIAEDDFTVIIENASSVNLPAPDNAAGGINTGQIYILKNITGGAITIDGYINADGSNTNETNLPTGITKLQSDGTNWHQIN